MVLHLWLLPLLGIAVIGVLAFLYAIKFTGGSGMRTSGRTTVEKPVEDDEEPLAAHREKTRCNDRKTRVRTRTKFFARRARPPHSPIPPSRPTVAFSLGD